MEAAHQISVAQLWPRQPWLHMQCPIRHCPRPLHWSVQMFCLQNGDRKPA